MAKLFQQIVKRNKNMTDDQEFEVHTSDDFNDKKFRLYSQESKITKESDIIKDIESNVDYRTDQNTPVEVGNRNGKKYIHSIPNGSTKDNIINLPTY